MKAPRFRIAWLMVAVAIAALDFAAIRAAVFTYLAFDYLVLGALPMVNVLAVGILVGQRRPRSRPFVLGFEVFGAMAMAIFVAYGTLAMFFPSAYGPLNWYLAPILAHIEASIGRDRPFLLIPVFCSIWMAIFGLPQVAFALLGGFLSRRFKITITRR